MMRRAATVAIPVVLLTVSGPAALAAWISTGGSASSVTATSVNAGQKPTATRVVTSPTVGSVTLSWAASTLASGVAVGGYDVLRQSGTTTTPVCQGVSTTSCLDTAPLPGSVSYSVVPRIGDNWVGPASPIETFQFDAFAPTTSIERTPVAGAGGWNTGDVNVKLTASDPGPVASGVKEIRYTIDGGTVNVVSGSVAEFTVTQEQQHQISYWSVDNLDNIEGPAGSANVKIDKTPPVSTITMVGDKARLSATDTGGSGLDKIEYRVGPTGSYSVYTAEVTMTAGQTIYVRAFDIAGNQESPDKSHTYNPTPSDTTPPSTVVSSNPARNTAGWTKADTTLTLTSTDNVQVAKLEWRIGTTGSFTTITGPGPYVLPQFTTEGETTIQYQATDTSNNVESLKTYVVKIDKTVPTVGDVRLFNKPGGAAGSAELGDSIVLTLSEKLDASSVCSTWTNSDVTNTLPGDSNDVVVTISDNAANDMLIVSSTNCPTLNFGSVALGANYVSGNVTFKGSQGADRSSVSLTPTGQLTITLGSPSPSTKLNSGLAAASPVHTPPNPSTWKDVAGNLLSTAPKTGTSSRF